MKSYRIYIVGADGRLQLGQAFEAVDDVEAAARAVDLAERRLAAELWEGGRLVGRVLKSGGFSSGAGGS